MSACPSCTPSQLGGLMLPAWQWAPSLSALPPGWEGALARPEVPGWGGLGGMLDLVIFPSLCNNLLNLLICLSLTFKYLNSLTLSINSWHSSIEVVEIMDTSCCLQKSLCLALLSRRLLMDYTLACKRSLSAFLMIFIEPLRTYIRCWISFLPHTWWSPAVVGWKLVLYQQMFCSRESTNYLMIQQQNEKPTQKYVLSTALKIEY